jgi:hypothetical protein
MKIEYRDNPSVRNVVCKMIQFVTGAIVLAWPLSAMAWVFTFDSPINLFLENSYLAFSPNPIKVDGDPHSPVTLIFEAQVAPNLFFPQLSNGNMDDPSGEYVFSAVVTPRIQLRMLNEQSSPVIPPSYNPKITLQFIYLKDWRLEPEHFRAVRLGTNLIFAHYSNGQSGCFFANQTGTDPNCVPAQGQPPLNEVSGSFSTNYIRGELHGQLFFDGDLTQRSAWVIDGSAALEVNSSVGPGGISDDQRRVYGKGHIGLAADGERYWSGNRGRVSLALSIPYGETPVQEPTVSIEATYLPVWLSGFGAFVRYVNGQDYYNILFPEHMSLWLFGVSFDLGPGNRALPFNLGSSGSK